MRVEFEEELLALGARWELCIGTREKFMQET